VGDCKHVEHLTQDVASSSLLAGPPVLRFVAEQPQQTQAQVLSKNGEELERELQSYDLDDIVVLRSIACHPSQKISYYC